MRSLFFVLSMSAMIGLSVSGSAIAQFDERSQWETEISAALEKRGGAGKFDLDVVLDFSTFDSVSMTAPIQQFYIGGTIYEKGTLEAGGPGPDDEPIGDFHCWGWFFTDSDRVVNQEFNLFDRGKIQVQGIEDDGPRAVTGGTGDFRNVRGEATGFDVFGDSFTAHFKLNGAKK